jgi:Tfp pilus assembly protein PilV
MNNDSKFKIHNSSPMILNSKFKIQNSSHGFSTLELLISITIIITALSAVIIVVFSNQTVSLDNQINNEALIKANNLIEQARSSSSFDFSSLGNSPTATDDIFKKELMVTDVNPCKKTGIASVSWATDPKRPLQIQIETTFGNPFEAIALGGDCGPENPPPTNWQNIVCTSNPSPGSPTWDFSPSGIPATGIEVIKRGATNYAIITSQGSAGGQSDFWVVNVTNRASLGVATVNIETGSGLNDVDVVGNYAYVANNETTKQFQIIDITNLSAPDRIASVSLSSTGSGTQAKAIAYFGGRVYIGTDYISPVPNEFQIFDVSNPLSPSPVPGGYYNVDHNIYKIIVRNQVVSGVPKILAYLAVSDSAGNKPKMIVLDVTNPTALTPVSLMGAYSPSPNDVLYGTALHVLGNNAYLGRKRSNSGVGDLVSINIKNPAIPAVSDHEFLGMGSNTETRAVIASGPLLFMSTSDNNKGFQVWNISNPSNLALVGTCKYPQEPLDMDFDGNFIYVVNRSQDALRIIYDPANPFP